MGGLTAVAAILVGPQLSLRASSYRMVDHLAHACIPMAVWLRRRANQTVQSFRQNVITAPALDIAPNQSYIR